MSHHKPLILNVISANILQDKGKTDRKLILPQDARIMSVAASLKAFPGSLDVVAVQETYKSEFQHNGEVLAAACGLEAHWENHNQKQENQVHNFGRANEYIGLMGEMIGDVEVIDIGGNRKALMTVVGGVAIFSAHLRAGYKPKVVRQARAERIAGAKALVEAADSYENSVIALDRNEISIPMIAPVTGLLRRAGFRSAPERMGRTVPKTFPRQEYQAVHGTTRQFELDAILVRGERIKVLASGIVRQLTAPFVLGPEYAADTPLGPSDHEWPYATLRIDS